MQEPLYRKIANDLHTQINEGKFKAGDKLPTENEISQIYSVSRITSKRALTELEYANLIYRVRGKGSFVQELKHITPFTNKVLFLLPFVNDLSLGDFTKGLEPVLKKNNLELIMSSVSFLESKSAKDIRNEFCCLIYYVTDPHSYLDILYELHENRFPVVILDKKINDIPFLTVQSDNFNGGYIATQYLIGLKHKKIGYLLGSEAPPQSVRQRYLGYLRAISEENLPFHTSIDNKHKINSELVSYLKENNITALVCENDVTAIMANNLIKRNNLSVPHDFSIVGFDNIQASTLVDPSLTTIEQDFNAIGRVAGELLVNEIYDHKEEYKDIKLPVKLIVRDSTKPNY